MGQAILIRDQAGVLSVFDKHDKPVWSLWETKAAPAFSCNDTDEVTRRTELIYYLDLIQQSNSAADFTIKFHEETGKKVNNNTPVIGQISFRLNQALERPGTAAAGGGNMDLLNQIFASKLEMMEMKWQSKFDEQEREHQAELDDADKELEEKTARKKSVGGVIGMIGDAGEQYPWMQDIIKEGVSFLKENLKDVFTVAKHKMNKHAANYQQQEPAIGKVPHQDDMSTATPDKRMNHALQILIKYNADRFGWPAGTTAEEIASATPEQAEAANKKGFTMLADTLMQLTELCKDNDIYDLAIKKLKAL